MKSFIRFLKTKSLFFFFLTIRKKSKEINQKPLGFTKNLQKRFLKKTSLTRTFFNPFLSFLKKRK